MGAIGKLIKTIMVSKNAKFTPPNWKKTIPPSRSEYLKEAKIEFQGELGKKPDAEDIRIMNEEYDAYIRSLTPKQRAIAAAKNAKIPQIAVIGAGGVLANKYISDAKADKRKKQR